MRAAPLVARSMSPLRFHNAARSTRPPSRGKPGSRLKAPRRTLTLPRYRRIARAVSGVLSVRPTARATPPRIRLESGPAPAIRASLPGDRDSSSRLETPPSTNSVMLLTGMPWRLAISEWASSWMMTETKSSRAEMTATIQ